MTGYVFGAPWAMAIKVITVVTIIVVCIPVYIFITLPEGAAWLGCLMVGGPVLFILTCAGYTIRGYQLDGSSLLIHRLRWTNRLDLVGLKSVDYDPSAMSRSIRIFGNGGCFSITGWFWNRKLGRYRAFVMDPKRAVVLRFSDYVLVVSPDQPAKFVVLFRELHGL